MGFSFSRDIVGGGKKLLGDAAPVLGLVNPMLGASALGVGKGEGIADSIGSTVDDITGKTAADAAKRAGMTQAAAQMEMLDYLKEINAAPQEYKEAALSELAGLYGVGGESNQQVLIDRAKASPLYQEIMGGQKAGEEAIMRQSSQTGGLRSGNVQSAMYDYNTQLQNKALSQTYGQQLQGLQSLAGLQTGTGQIAQTMSDIGTTQAQSILAQAGAQQQGTQNLMNLGLGIGGMIL